MLMQPLGLSLALLFLCLLSACRTQQGKSTVQFGGHQQVNRRTTYRIRATLQPL